MPRWSLRSLFVVVGLCAVASRVASEAVEYRAQERGLAGLRGLGPAITVDSRLVTAGIGQRFWELGPEITVDSRLKIFL